jgi:hypothetical protein
MTPKEKAKELVNNMFNCDKSTPEESMAMLYPHAKQCALISVDEIIEIVYNSLTSIQELNYWLEVKDEIEKL